MQAQVHPDIIATATRNLAHYANGAHISQCNTETSGWYGAARIGNEWISVHRETPRGAFRAVQEAIARVNPDHPLCKFNDATIRPASGWPESHIAADRG